MHARLVSTEGARRPAVVEVDGRRLRVIDSFSGDRPLPPDTPLADVEMVCIVAADGKTLDERIRENPRRQRGLIAGSDGRCVALGRIVSIDPVVVDCGLLTLDLWDWRAEPRHLGCYVAAAVERLEMIARPQTQAGAPPVEMGAADYAVAPISAEDEQRIVAARGPDMDQFNELAAPVPADQPVGFSLRQLMGLLTMGTVTLGLTRLFERSAAAFLLGLAVILGIFMLADDTRAGSPILRIAWWGLLTLYLLTAMMALLGI